tara:strand:- start:479 stop:3184 length:2706 start_codon:yes stop_codon:yes gene_type:complete
MYSVCSNVGDQERNTRNSLGKLRQLFNGDNVEIDGKKYNIGDSISKYYGKTDSDGFGEMMFDEIVWRSTYKPAFDSYTDFKPGDFKRIKNEIIKESKNLNNPKLNYLERYGFVRRGVMQKFAVTKYMNDKINQVASYERNQFQKYLNSHIEITGLLRAEILSKNGKSKYWPSEMTWKKLEKLENDLIISTSDPNKINRAQDISEEIAKLLDSEGGKVLEDLRLLLEGDGHFEKKSVKVGGEEVERWFKILKENTDEGNIGDEVRVSDNIVKAAKISRNLLDDMGDVMISGLEQHKKVVRQFYLNTNESLLTESGTKVKRYEKTINEEIKRIKDGKKGGKYFPHYLVEAMINMERVMDRAENPESRDINKDLPELSEIISETHLKMGTPSSTKFRKSVPYENYLKNPIGVMRKYSLDAISFNKANFLRNTYQEGLRRLPRDADVAIGLENYLQDTFTLANKGFNDRPQWVNKTVRALTGFQFLSKLGFGLGTAARNTMSGLYFIQGVGNRAFSKYLSDYRNPINKDIVKKIEDVEKEMGFTFEDISAPIFTEGLVPTKGVQVNDLDIRQDDNGNHTLQYRDGKTWKAFDSALTAATGKGAIFQRITENKLRQHMFRYSFMTKYNELVKGGLNESKATGKAKRHAVDQVGKYAFEYSASQKAPVAGGSGTKLGAAGQIAFQFMHYPMSFLQLQSEVLRKSKDAAIAGQWSSPDLVVPLRFAGLYLFTELMSGIANLDLHRLMENDTVERIQTLKKALDGEEDVKGRGFLGPTISDLYFYATMNDWMQTPDHVVADIIVGYSDAYGMTDEQKRARMMSTLNVQASKIINKDLKALRNGNGWDVMMHEFGVYPTKETREMRKKQPYKTIFPEKKDKKEKTPAQLKAQKRIDKDVELTKLYRAMGI